MLAHVVNSPVVCADIFAVAENGQDVKTSDMLQTLQDHLDMICTIFMRHYRDFAEHCLKMNPVIAKVAGG